MAFAEKPRLTLEDYDRFFHLPEDRSFNLDQLQQVMLMHGFVKLKTKLAIVAGMKTVDMMPPTRSTLRARSATYSCASISLEEIRADIAALDWQECPVGSLITVGPGAGTPPPPSSTAVNAPPVAAAVATLSPAVALATAVVSKRRRRKKKRLAEAASSPAAASEAAASPGAAQAAAGAATGRKRRRKRRASVQLSGYVLN